MISIAILGLCFLAPVKRLDVAKLQPVETVAVYLQGSCVVLETDWGEKGEGATALEALQSLRDNAHSVIYLDTAQYLLVGVGAQQQVEQLRPHLKERVKVGSYNGGDVAEETKYWKIHGSLPPLSHWKWAP